MNPNPNTEEEFKVRISGDGVDVERVIDGETLAAVMTILVTSDLTRQELISGIGDVTNITQTTKVPLSLREYLDSVNAKKKADQIVAIGSFLLNYENRSNFSRDEVRSRFASAHEPIPTNFFRDFKTALKSGMIAQVHQKEGFFYVTNLGIQAVEDCFSKKRTTP